MQQTHSQKDGIVEQYVRGSGNPADPKVSLLMYPWMMNTSNISSVRQEACIKIAWSAAKALDFSGVRIRHWNHDQQYAYDENGQRIRVADRNGIPQYKLEVADSHITVTFYHVGCTPRYPAHVYTVDGPDKVPQRLMLIGERKHTRPHDKQSPQVWLDPRVVKAVSNMNLGGNIDQKRLQEALEEITYFDIDEGVNLTEAETYPRLFDDISDAEMLEWGYSPEIIVALKAQCGDRDWMVRLSKSG
ncbi:hypothetical protein SLS62_009670 [Diatrype stigma]|uniref:Uncharacterized protein n=1 Tax=Diatrype stigma TaxID=117547 RepID=A0AAN9UCE2_9PEZI